MTRFQTVAAVLVTVIMIGAIPAFGADFYETQLRLGAESFRAGRFVEAVDYLRIANFGLLERTDLLSEGLARLAMAESAANRTEELQKTLTRFLALERQYARWAKAAVSPEERQAFEKLLLATLPKEAINSVPTFAALGVTTPEPAVEMTPAEKRRELEKKAASDSSNPQWALELARDAQSRGDAKAVLKWSAKALAADDTISEAHAMRLSIFTARKDDKAAFTELRATSEEAWTEFPSIVPDAFVVYTRSKNYEQADAIALRVKEEDLARADVSAAMESWRARTAKASVPAPSVAVVPAAVSDPPAVVTAPPAAVVEVPPATPVGGSGDVADTRSEASRGSFTGGPDRIGAALTSAKKLMNASRAPEAQRVLRDELIKTPGSRELRLALLEASCLARDWRTGEAQISLVEPFRTGEDRYRFYASVILFESGKEDPAKRLMAEAAPHIAPSPFVDHYVKVILGEQ